MRTFTWSAEIVVLLLIITTSTSFSQTFSSVSIGSLSKSRESRSLWADLDNDGDADLVLSMGYDSSVIIYKNNGGSLVFHSTANLPVLLHSIMGAADFNRDGFIDLVLSGVVDGGDDRPTLTGGIYINNGTGTFTKLATGFTPLQGGTVDCADFDHDGDVDILMTGFDRTLEAKTIIMTNHGDGKMTEMPHQLPGVAGDGVNGSWGDYDRDGDADILLSGSTFDATGRVGLTKIYTNNGNRTFTESTISLTQYQGKADWVDVNNDGALDIFVSGFAQNSSNFSTLYLNQSGNFVIGAALATSVILTDFSWVDLDGDGDRDLVGVDQQGASYLFVNNSGTLFSELTSFDFPNHTQVSVTDFNNDGRYDIFFSGYTTGFAASILALTNTSTFTNNAPAPPTNLTTNISGQEVQFSWDASTDAESAAGALQYILKVGSSSGGSNIVSPNASSTVLKTFKSLGASQTLKRSLFNLPNGTYYASVQAIDQSGKVSAPSDETTFTITNASVLPIAPNNLMLAVTSKNFVELNWIDQSWNETGFEIERAEDGASFALLTSVASDTMTYLDKTAETGKTYHYRVRSVNGDGWSTYSASQSILNPNGLFRQLEGFEIAPEVSKPTSTASFVDYNQDGFDDLLLAGSGENFLYRNKQDGTFDKITTGDIVNSGNVVNREAIWADYDNDGDMDAFVPTSFEGRLFRNDGGVFTSIVVLPSGGYTDVTAASWADYDNDGFLDLAIGHFQSTSTLLHNNGNGTFTKVTQGYFVEDVASLSSIAWCDYNNDGWQDCLALNYGGQSTLYQNNKGVLERVSSSVNNSGSSSVTASWADYDNDGDFDVFIGNNTNFQSDMFFKNNGDGTFSSVLNNVTAAFIQSQASTWGDLDNDGNLDLIVGGDNERIVFTGNTEGSFERRAAEPSLAGPRYAQGLALGDLNRDGFLDAAFSNSAGDPVAVLKNTGNSNHWISFRLQGTFTNKSAIGARVIITTGGKKQINYVSSHTGAHSQNSLNVHFGLGTSTNIDSVVVEWPLRGFQILTDVAADQFMTLIEPALPVAPTSVSAAFNDATQHVQVSWEQTPTATKYVVQRSIGNRDAFQTVSTTNAPTLTFEEDMPVELDSVYYRLFAITPTGATWSSEVKKTFCGLRSAENVEAELQNDEIEVTWTDKSGKEAQYEIFRSTNGVDYDKIASVQSDVPRYSDLAIAEQMNYHYTVRAINGDVVSKFSDFASQQTPLKAPTNLSFVLEGNTIQLSWADHSQKETSYVIEQSIGTNDQYEAIGTTAANATTFSHTGLSFDQPIFFRVKASNGIGDSYYSNELYTLITAAETMLEEEVEVYPNPASIILYVNATGEKNVSIINMIGTEFISRQSPFKTMMFDVRHLPQGIYLVNTKVSGRVVTKKISIVR